MSAHPYHYRPQWLDEPSESGQVDDLNATIYSESSSGSDSDDLASWSSDNEGESSKAFVERRPIRRKMRPERSAISNYGAVKEYLEKSLRGCDLFKGGSLVHFGKTQASQAYRFAFDGQLPEHSKCSVDKMKQVENALKTSFEILNELDFTIVAGRVVRIKGKLRPLRTQNSKRSMMGPRLLDVLATVVLLVAACKHFEYIP